MPFQSGFRETLSFSGMQECAKKLIRCGKHCNSFMPNQTTTAEADDVAREPQEDEHAVHDLWEYPVIGRIFQKSHLPSGKTKGENMIKKDDLERKHLRMRVFAHAVLSQIVGCQIENHKQIKKRALRNTSSRAVLTCKKGQEPEMLQIKPLRPFSLDFAAGCGILRHWNGRPCAQRRSVARTSWRNSLISGYNCV